MAFDNNHLKKNNSLKILRNDLLLIVFLLAMAATIFFVFILGAKEGKFVTVTVDGDKKAYYLLSIDKKIKLFSKQGQFNTLVIEDGKAFVSDASCPDKICVSHRAISKEGETIICLPNKTVISITVN